MGDTPVVKAYADVSLDDNPGLGSVSVVIDVEPRIERTFDLDAPLSINQAEYLGVLLAIRIAADSGLRRLVVFTDNQVVARQVNGQYRCRVPHLRTCLLDVESEMTRLESCEVRWLARKLNRVAHTLANKRRKKPGGSPSEVP